MWKTKVNKLLKISVISVAADISDPWNTSSIHALRMWVFVKSRGQFAKIGPNKYITEHAPD